MRVCFCEFKLTLKIWDSLKSTAEKGTTAVKLEGCSLLSKNPAHGVFQGGYQKKWNGPSSCELLHYRNICAPEEHHPLYWKSATFSYRSTGINKE